MTRRTEEPYCRLTTCRHCRGPVLSGLCDALDVVADPHAVTVAGEIAALLARRLTFTAHIIGHRVKVFRRATWDRRESTDNPVLVEHHCKSPPADYDAVKTRRFVDMFIPSERPTECPF